MFRCITPCPLHGSFPTCKYWPTHEKTSPFVLLPSRCSVCLALVNRLIFPTRIHSYMWRYSEVHSDWDWAILSTAIICFIFYNYRYVAGCYYCHNGLTLFVISSPLRIYYIYTYADLVCAKFIGHDAKVQDTGLSIGVTVCIVCQQFKSYSVKWKGDRS
jgi:hypothetical protein